MERERVRKREGREGGWLIDWALLLLPWFPWVPIVLLRKQDSAGVSALGYIYTHPAAQLLSSSQLQTAGEQDAFQGDHFLMVFILDFSEMISAFISFWWRGWREGGGKESELVCTVLWCQCKKSVISSRHKRGRRLSFCWGLFAIQPGLCLGKRLKSHTLLHRVIVPTHPWLSFLPPERQHRAKGNVKRRRGGIPLALKSNLDWILTVAVHLCDLE